MSGGCDREETDEEQAWREGAAHERARILGPHATAADASELAGALQAYHQGTERGELRRLLVMLRGPSPALASDLRGLAARESQAGRPRWAAGDRVRHRESGREFTLLPGRPAAAFTLDGSHWHVDEWFLDKEFERVERPIRPGDPIAPGDEIRVKFHGSDRPTTVMVHLDIEPREP